MLDTGLDPDLAPSAVQQSRGFARALKACGVPHSILPQGALMVERRFGPLRVGMLTRPDVNDIAEMRGMLDSLRPGGPLILAPERPMDLRGLGAVALVSPVTLAVLDLAPSLDRLWDGLHPKWRNRLCHAQRQTIRISRRAMPDDPAHWLLDADAALQSRRGYRGWPRALTLAFARENPGDAKLFSAHWGRSPVAAMLVLRHGRTATYHIGHSRASGRIVSAHNLLMWNVIQWAKTKGLERLDLGTINTEDAPGLARFKLGTGARPYPLGGTWLHWSPLAPVARPLAALNRGLMRIGG